jgi:hypothetical protein
VPCTAAGTIVVAGARPFIRPYGAASIAFVIVAKPGNLRCSDQGTTPIKINGTAGTPRPSRTKL